MVSGSASLPEGCGPAPLRRVTVEAPDGLPLSVRVGGVGSAPPILLLHGFTGSSEAWGERLLDVLCARHRTVAVLDLVGHGASARPHDPERYRLESVLNDVAAVQDQLVGEAAVWIGYSMGGRIALAGAALAAAPVRALVIESGSPGVVEEAERDVRCAADEAWARLLDAGDLERFVDRWLDQPVFRSQRALPSATIQRERARRMQQDPHALAACLRGLGSGTQPSVWRRLGEVRVPTLLLTGGLDEKFEALAAAMASVLPDVRHVSVAAAGHAVHLEAPDAWMARIGEFLVDGVG
jgi:2-succinyl-6-hydroxy-2,4-cyclohexadiene-1-carboxylate synthase